MDLELRGHTAIVTGATAGIGRAIALALAEEGVSLAIVGRRQNLLEDVRDGALERGAESVVVIAQDMLEESAAASIVAAAHAALGRIDTLVNCAGGSIDLDLDAPDEMWESAMTLNWERHRQLTHGVLDEMRQHGRGRIINITGRSESRGLNASMSAKAAVHAWAKGVVDIVAKDGVTVNCVAPGRILSEQIERLYPQPRRDEVARAEIPAGRFGDPRELANLVVFLASDRAAYMNGEVIHVDGGARRSIY